MGYRGSTLILDRGRIVITSDSIVFPPELDYGTNEEFIKMFVLTYVKFLSDSPLVSECGDKPVRLYAHFLRSLTNEHVSVVIKRYANLANTLLQQDYVTGVEASTSFFLPDMMDLPIAKEYITWFKTGRPELLKYILSFLLFGKKLEYVDPEFDTTALRGWYEVEERLRTLVFAENDISILRNIVSVLLAPAAKLDLLPKFGPGRVMERGVVGIWGKLRSLTHDPKLAYAFLRERPFRGSDAGYGIDHAMSEVMTYRAQSRLKFVPKDITKSRSICMEPNGYMFYQQEVLRLIVDSMERGLIGRFVNLKDQEENRYSATHGSKYLSSDTIDLSSASDSVHVDLVRKIFPKDLLFYMLATRTSEVIVPDSKNAVAVNKFAPMGSAVCFPTQCIIFTAVCLYAYMIVHEGIDATGDWIPTEQDVVEFIRHHLHRQRNSATPFTRRYEPPVVYGDDIICDSRVTDVVVTILLRLGFQPNVAKSFRGSQSFRESCGVYAYQGIDVTPIQFRVPFFKKGRDNWDAKVLSSMIASVNNFNANGYTAVGTFLLSILKDHGYKTPLPFTTDPDAFGIFTRNKHRVSKTHLRWNADWQTYEERALAIAQKPDKDAGIEPDNLERYRYAQWWRARIRIDTPISADKVERSLRIRPEETRVVPRWTRCEM